MNCELLGIDVENRKAKIKCDDVEETINISNSNCRIVQQGKDPPKVIAVECK